MKDLSKDERLEQRVSNLEQRISEKVNECDKKKWLRGKITFFVLSIAIYILALMADIISGVAELLGWLIISPITAGFVMFISYLVLGYIITGAMEDEKAIAKLIGTLEEVKFNKHE